MMDKFTIYNENYKRYFLICIQNQAVSIIKKPDHLLDQPLTARAEKYKELIELVYRNSIFP
jgi:hypothetical protein